MKELVFKYLYGKIWEIVSKVNEMQSETIKKISVNLIAIFQKDFSENIVMLVNVLNERERDLVKCQFAIKKENFDWFNKIDQKNKNNKIIVLFFIRRNTKHNKNLINVVSSYWEVHCSWSGHISRM